MYLSAERVVFFVIPSLLTGLVDTQKTRLGFTIV